MAQPLHPQGARLAAVPASRRAKIKFRQVRFRVAPYGGDMKRRFLVGLFAAALVACSSDAQPSAPTPDQDTQDVPPVEDHAHMHMDDLPDAASETSAVDDAGVGVTSLAPG